MCLYAAKTPQVLTPQWHAGILAAHGGLDRLRAAERAAKERRLGVWEGLTAPTGKSAANGGSNSASPQTSKGTSFDATVVRVWGSDTISVIAKGDEKETERKMQLASVRGPR